MKTLLQSKSLLVNKLNDRIIEVNQTQGGEVINKAYINVTKIYAWNYLIEYNLIQVFFDGVEEGFAFEFDTTLGADILANLLVEMA